MLKLSNHAALDGIDKFYKLQGIKDRHLFIFPLLFKMGNGFRPHSFKFLCFRFCELAKSELKNYCKKEVMSNVEA